MGSGQLAGYCLEGRMCSRIYVEGKGWSCCCIAHGETSQITNSFGICMGNPTRTQAINRIGDFRPLGWQLGLARACHGGLLP